MHAVLQKVEEEGMEKAFLEVFEGVFCGDGGKKYPVGYWRSKSKKEHAQKAAGHIQMLIEGEECEAESLCHHRAHAILRHLMLLQLELEEGDC